MLNTKVLRATSVLLGRRFWRHDETLPIVSFREELLWWVSNHAENLYSWYYSNTNDRKVGHQCVQRHLYI
ncbi:hypothetical protein SERLADRAFT_476874 [Serpula lacrymans var. lacrymans S7.9]|uniref:Uncharacterized protein n=1 Tax=Serpula lacrymans var. lacrymans (strain S7.9) TaxID=578457 RepID=F8P813_SERL9|nr:uncharacterized protein SERLADRAFT_476874 [Serpula lacrymans var. lacrymans S7.9]EGO20571.1 hypothetical protein SERLADRAFT_476874 [Serpula lacrymans var. lacrymans S7.9]